MLEARIEFLAEMDSASASQRKPNDELQQAGRQLRHKVANGIVGDDVVELGARVALNPEGSIGPAAPILADGDNSLLSPMASVAGDSGVGSSVKNVRRRRNNRQIDAIDAILANGRGARVEIETKRLDFEMEKSMKVRLDLLRCSSTPSSSIIAPGV